MRPSIAGALLVVVTEHVDIVTGFERIEYRQSPGVGVVGGGVGGGVVVGSGVGDGVITRDHAEVFPDSNPSSKMIAVNAL